MAPDQENDHDSQAEEILNYRASNRDVHPREHSDDEEEEELSDDDSEFEVIHDPLSQQPPSRRKHSASTVQSFELYTPEEERAVIRKLDRGVVLPLAGLYLLSFIDRSNIGNAKIAGLTQDLSLSAGQFEWLLTGFYITYISFEPMILFYHIIPAHIYISLTALTWGLFATLQSCTTSFPSLLLLRLGLGAAEAAFSPGIPYYLSFFYRRDELAYRTGLQLAAAPLASSFAGTLAYLITKLGQRGPFAPWRLLFLVEGFPSVIAAVFAWGFVADGPGSAKFLTERERRIAGLRLRREGVVEDKVREGMGKVKGEGVGWKGVDWKGIWETLGDPKCYVTAIMFLSCNIAFSSMPVFLPTVINEMGYTTITSQALSAPPYLLAFLLLLVTAHLSDKYQTRTPFIMLHAALGGLGYTLCTLGGIYHWSNTTRYLSIYPACIGFFSCVTLLITLTINNQPSSERKGTGMTILNVVGQLGPLLGTRLYPDGDGPFYVRGMGVCAAAMAGVFLGALFLRRVLRRENERLAREEGNGDVDGVLGTELLGRGEVKRREGFRLML